MCIVLGKHKKKQTALNAIAAHCVFKINASFYLFAFLLFTFFFSRLLQGGARAYLPADIEYLSKKDIIKKVTYVVDKSSTHVQLWKLI